jgi:hypothetical protein
VVVGDQGSLDGGAVLLDFQDRSVMFKRRITELEQENVELTRRLEERGEELDAARAANREMITQLNVGQRGPARQGRES